MRRAATRHLARLTRFIISPVETAARGGGAQGLLDLADPGDHLLELAGQQADLVVVALQLAVDGEVLLDDLGAEADRRDRHVVAALVAGVAHRALPDLGQPLEVAQVDVLERRGVGRLAVQQRVRRAVCRGAGRRSRGSRPRWTCRSRRPSGCRAGHVPQQGVVGQVGGGDLERRDAVRPRGGRRWAGPRPCTSPRCRRRDSGRRPRRAGRP